MMSFLLAVWWQQPPHKSGVLCPNLSCWLEKTLQVSWIAGITSLRSCRSVVKTSSQIWFQQIRLWPDQSLSFEEKGGGNYGWGLVASKPNSSLGARAVMKESNWSLWRQLFQSPSELFKRPPLSKSYLWALFQMDTFHITHKYAKHFIWDVRLDKRVLKLTWLYLCSTIMICI